MSRKVYFFLPDVTGGVAMVVNNVVQFSDIEAEVRVVAYHDQTDLRPKAVFSKTVESRTSRLSYHSFDNKREIIKKLYAKIDQPEGSVMVATDSLELVMIQAVRMNVSCVFIVLGDFDHYYGIANEHQNIIDKFIAISMEIYHKLLMLFPDRAADIIMLYFPTPVTPKRNQYNLDHPLRILYVARLEESKNPMLLVEIEAELQAIGVKADWSIVGSGEMEPALRKALQARGFNNFKFHGTLGNNELQSIYLANDVFVLTSKFEGMPVSLIEAMKSGLVPIISDIPGGIREILKQGENGFLCEPGDASIYGTAIMLLDGDRKMLISIAENAHNGVIEQFGASKNADAYMEFIRELQMPSTQRIFFCKLNKLDSKFLPSFVVRKLRTIKHHWND